MKRTTIALPDDLSELVEHEARRQGVSVSELIRRYLKRALLGTPSEPRSIPFAGIIDDPGMVRGDEVDEALKETWADELDRGR